MKTAADAPAPFSESTPIRTNVRTVIVVGTAFAGGLLLWFTSRQNIETNTVNIVTNRAESRAAVETLRADTRERMDRVAESTVKIADVLRAETKGRLDEIRVEQMAQRGEMQGMRDILMRIDERTARMPVKP